MGFKVKVKLGGINNLSDARFAAAAGVDYLGFCFDKHTDFYIPPIKAKEMIDWVNGSDIVAEFGNQTIDEIKDITELLDIDVIEVDNRLLPDELRETGKAIIKKIDTAQFTKEQLKIELEAYHQVADAFHLYASDSSIPENEFLKELAATYHIIYGFDIMPQHIVSIIDTIQPYAINLVGGEEEKAGVKDFDSLNEILDTILTDEE